jgi:hypothetical protein
LVCREVQDSIADACVAPDRIGCLAFGESASCNIEPPLDATFILGDLPVNLVVRHALLGGERRAKAK